MGRDDKREIFGETKFLHQLGIMPIFPVAVVFFEDVLCLQLPKAVFVRPKSIVTVTKVQRGRGESNR